MDQVIRPGAMTGTVALVTGGGSGIGRASALAFVAQGARVVVADVDVNGGEATVRQVREAGGEGSFVRTDVSIGGEVAVLVATTLERYGRLDYAHNNAGIEGVLGGLLDYPEEVWDRVMAVNLKGVWLCMKYEIPPMLAQGGGAIVNTASVAGVRAATMLFGYGASKHGVVGITKSAAREFAGRGIRFNAICPSLIDTPMAERAFGEATMTRVGTSHPMGRLGTAEEVAQAVVWLCSDGASYVNGVALLVDGSSEA